MREPRGARIVKASPREVERDQCAKALIKPDADQVRNRIVKFKSRSGDEFEGPLSAFSKYLDDRRQQRLVDLSRFIIRVVVAVCLVATIGPAALPALALPRLLSLK